MAIDAHEKSMLNPNSKGDNYGITADLDENAQRNKGSIRSTSGINKCLGMVSRSGASGQENFNLKNLGRPIGGNSNGE